MAGTQLKSSFKKKKSSIKYIGKKGNSDICKYLIKNIKINYNSKITNIKFNSKYWTVTLNNNNQVFFKYLILTCPFPQLKSLSSKYLNQKILNLNVKMLPNITVMAVYKNYKELPMNSIKFNDEMIAWAAQENTKKRFKTNKILWTIQCTESFSYKSINLFKRNKNKYLSLITKKFQNLLGFQIKNIVFKSIHGWMYSYSKSRTSLECFWNNKSSLGVCADWFNGPNAEDAWLSANSLYKKIKKNPPFKGRV